MDNPHPHFGCCPVSTSILCTIGQDPFDSEPCESVNRSTKYLCVISLPPPCPPSHCRPQTFWNGKGTSKSFHLLMHLCHVRRNARPGRPGPIFSFGDPPLRHSDVSSFCPEERNYPFCGTIRQQRRTSLVTVPSLIILALTCSTLSYSHISPCGMRDSLGKFPLGHHRHLLGFVEKRPDPIVSTLPRLNPGLDMVLI